MSMSANPCSPKTGAMTLEIARAYRTMEGHAMGVVAENRLALDYIDRAEEIDQECDDLTREAFGDVDKAIQALGRGRVEEARRLLEEARRDGHRVMVLDEIEEELWRARTSEHIQESSEEGRAIIAACQPAAIATATALVA